MGLEIERKFLIRGTPWLDAGSVGVEMHQGYLASGPASVVRVRLTHRIGWLCVKGHTQGISRSEFEYEVPVEDARSMLELCGPSRIHKTRYILREGGGPREGSGDAAAADRWEVDVFHDENEGLVVAELELRHEEQVFARPSWLGEEVSHDPRYRNSSLALTPFLSWEQNR